MDIRIWPFNRPFAGNNAVQDIIEEEKMPTFTPPDPYEGWTEPRLKRRCRRLCRAVDNWQHIAMVVAEHGKDGLSPSDRETLERLIEAYRD